MKICTLNEAVAHIPPSANIFVQGGCATPIALLESMVANAARFKQATLYHLHTSGEARYASPDYKDNFRVMNLFVGENVRRHLDGDRVDYLPCFLSEIPSLFQNHHIPLDAALIQVSPPDAHGYCSLGTSVDVVPAALASSPLIIAQINPHMPRTHGDSLVHQNRIHYGVQVDIPLPETPLKDPSPEELRIGEHVAALVENGATLQVGIGSIPDAVLRALTQHKDLGLHTEMFSDGMLPLFEKGVVNNSKKTIHPGKSVASFVTGSQKLFDWVHDNPSVAMLNVAYVNNPRVIAKNPRVTAINSAVEIDLSGQVCADSVGKRLISGVGGQIDFIRGASLSHQGRPIIALTSRSKKGFPRIVPQLLQGAGVVTTRAHVHWVVTEYGAVNLFGLSLGQRARALASIAHPDDREGLLKAARESAK